MKKNKIQNNSGNMVDKKRILGYIIAGIGFAMILANAWNYIFEGDLKSTTLTIFGLIFLAIGLKITKK